MLTNLTHLYYRFVFSFHRAIFYGDIADALRRRVNFKHFAFRMAENGKLLKDKTAQHIANSLLTTVENGRSQSLDELLKCVVPRNDLPLIRAAQLSADIPTSIDHLAKVVNFKVRMLRIVIGQSLLVTLMCLLAAGVAIYTADIIEKIIETSPSIKYTGFNSFIVSLSTFISNNGLSIIFSILLLLIAIILLVPRYTGRLRSRIDEWPFFSLYRDFSSANAISTLSMLLSSGLVLKDALNNIKNGANPWSQWQVRKITTYLDNNPSKLIEAFGLGLFSRPLRGRLASLADSSNSFEDAIIQLGRDELDRIEKQVVKTIQFTGGTLVFIISFIAILLTLGQNTIITQLYNDIGSGF